MESHILNKLADKYWKGECSDQEERQLSEALRYGKVPEGLEELAAYMRFLKEEKSKKLGLDFDVEILQKIEAKPVRRLFPYYVGRIAAGIALIAGLSWGIYSLSTPTEITETKEISEFVDTFEDSEEAYREVKKALMMLSSNMNDGMQHTSFMGEFHKATQDLERKN